MEEKCVSVMYVGSQRAYNFMTDLPLEVGVQYKITNDSGRTYSTPIVVLGYVPPTPLATAWIVQAQKID